MPSIKPVEKTEEKPAEKLPAVAQVEETDDDLPSDPDELKQHAKNLRKKLRAAERRLDDAGLTKSEEKRLADEVAKLQVQLAEVIARVAPKPEASPAPGETKTEIAAPAVVVDEDDCWLTIL